MSHTDRTNPDYFKNIPVWLAIKFMGKNDPSSTTSDQRKRSWRKREWKRDMKMEMYHGS